MAELNPRISETKIGVRELRTVTIYPLSIAHQLRIKDLAVKLMSIIDNRPKLNMGGKDTSEMAKLIEEEEGLVGDGIEFVEGIVEVIESSISQVIEFTTDPEDKVALDDITNEQLADIVDIIVTNNFEVAGKKLKGVAKRVLGLFR